VSFVIIYIKKDVTRRTAFFLGRNVRFSLYTIVYTKPKKPKEIFSKKVYTFPPVTLNSASDAGYNGRTDYG